MFVTPVRKRKADQITHLNSSVIDQRNKPRLSDGRTSRRTAQSHVSVTVRFDALENLRAKRKDQCLPNCWIDSGIQDKKNIQQVRRGDIALILQDSVPSRGLTGLTNSAVVFTHLNNWPKHIPIRVAGIVENPSQNRGQTQGQDNFGNIMARGVNTIVNQGKYMLVCGDYVYALMVPETVDMNGVTWSMNAIKGTGDGNGSHQDYNQKLVPQLIPLKHKDIRLLIDNIRTEISDHIVQVWETQKQNNSVFDVWANEYNQLQSRLHSDINSLIPGMEEYSSLFFISKSLERALNDFFNGIDKEKTKRLIKVVYAKGHEILRAYWKQAEKQFQALSNPDDMRRLARGTGEWLVPVGVLNIQKDMKRDVNIDIDLNTLSNPVVIQPNMDIVSQTKLVETNAYSMISTLQQSLMHTCTWIESNDVVQFLENSYVGLVLSAQAASGESFDIMR